MKIVVNNVAAQMGGAITLLKGLRDYIVEHDRENEWFFLLSKPYIEEAENVHVMVFENVKKSPIHRVIYDLSAGRKIERSLKPDLFFSMQNTLFKNVKTPQAVYMHQSLPFQDIKDFSPFKKSELKSWYYQKVVGRVIKKGLPKAKAIVVQTKWIKDAIAKLYPDIEDRITVVNPEVTAPKRDESLVWKQNEFFSPITDVSYKNAQCIYDAAAELDKRGIKDFNVAITFEGVSAHNHVTNTGFVSKHELFKRYQTSTMIFPSYIETFGLPIAEAKLMGTIVLASDCPFSHEILDGYKNAYFFDPFKPLELASLMEKIVCGEIVKEEIDREKTENDADMLSSTPGNSWEKVIGAITKCVTMKQ